MKRLLIASAALVVLASGIWLATGFDADPAARPRPETAAEPDEPEPEEDPDPGTAASEIVSIRARAVMKDDRGAFLSSIDPKAKRFLKQQRKIFDRLTSLSFGRYELEVQTGDGDLARREHHRRYKSADDVFIPRVEETYRFKG
ncbi:MAG TPA: hypothetical protein VFD47_08750, partial [Actinomycetota bacterium]|nr:hypothetical protein [Actinomycetota bacterium]